MNITRVGPHRFSCGDLMDPATIPALMEGHQADLIYNDPPWGQGALNMWQTLNTKDTGAAKRTLDLDAFLDALLGTIAQTARGYVLLEYGQDWRDEFIGRCQTHGLHHHDTICPTYRSGGKLRPYDLHLFGVTGVPRTTLNPKGADRHGIAVVREVLPPFATEGGVFLDPTCGLGLMAEVAAKNGMVVRGNEINRKRLQECLRRMERLA